MDLPSETDSATTAAVASEKGAILNSQAHHAGRADELRQLALQALCLRDPAEKAAACSRLYAGWLAGQIPLDADCLKFSNPLGGDELPCSLTASGPTATSADPEADTESENESDPDGLPGRPSLPQLVPPKEVRSRSPATREGRAAMLHAICHIEFNAMNLALDALWRFPGMPEAFYADWLQVAAEEATHFHLLRAHLMSLDADYGDFPAHDGLWAMAQRTRHDILARMALVPRTLEARGLDATPAVQERLRAVGDLDAVSILDIILRDEIGHVAIGNRWYAWLCELRGLNPRHHFRELAREYKAPRMKGELNLAARRAAGFTEEELADLQAAAGGHL